MQQLEVNIRIIYSRNQLYWSGSRSWEKPPASHVTCYSALENLNWGSSTDWDVQSGGLPVHEVSILNEKLESMSQYLLILQCRDWLTTPGTFHSSKAGGKLCGDVISNRLYLQVIGYDDKHRHLLGVHCEKILLRACIILEVFHKFLTILESTITLFHKVSF